MPILRQYPQATSLLATDALWIDRVGAGTMYIEAQSADLATSGRVSVAAFSPTGVFPTADDTAIWAAAVASGEPLWAPPVRSPVSTLALPNACNILGVRGKSILSSLPDGEPMLTLTNPYNTAISLEGLILAGNKGSQPATSTHRGIYFNNALSGVNDPLYEANSPWGVQVPAHYLNVIISGFVNEGAYLHGAGDNSYELAVYNCNGIGIRVDSYDNRFHNCIVAGSGLQNWLFELNGGSNTVTGGKCYYSGQLGVSGQTAGIEINNVQGVTITGYLIQDSSGSQLLILGNNYGAAHTFVGRIDRAGTPNYFDTATTAEIDIQGTPSCNIDAVVSNSGPVQAATYVLQNIAGAGSAGTNHNINIVTQGYAPIFEGSSGLLNISIAGNNIDINGNSIARAWMGDDNDNITFGLNQNGASVGITARGPNASSPGQLIAITQANVGELQGFTNTGVRAAQVLTFATNGAVGDHFTIGAVTYSLVSSLAWNSPANSVLRGANTAATISALHHAVNADGAYSGTLFSIATLPNPAVTATDNGVSTVTATAISTGTAGNSIASTTTSSHASWGAATLAGGSNGATTFTSSFNWTQTGFSSRPYLQASTTYANDAAAAGGGVAVAGEYRNGSVEQVRIS